MSSEWLQVMLAEIARKQHEAEQAGAEAERRRRESEPRPSAPAAPAGDAPARGP